MNDTVDRFYQATGELMVKAADYDALSARCEELERRLAGAWCVKELEWKPCDSMGSVRARTPFGTLYAVVDKWCEAFEWSHHRNGSVGGVDLHSLDAAKAAAQEWFNEKMTAGLRRVV